MVTRHWGALLGLVSLIGLGSLAVACGSSDDSTGSTNTGGSAGTGTAGTTAAGSGGSGAGTGGTSAAGTAGSTSTGGTAGTSSTGGSSGSGGGDDCTTADTCSKYKTPDGQGQPPAKPADSPVSGADVVEAVDALYVGDIDRDGTQNPDAWRKFGFDLDGWSTKVGQGFHCQPQKNGHNTDIRDDGDNGIDNSFGKNIVGGILTSFTQTPSQTVSESITGGSFSIVLKMEKLGDATTGTSVKTQLYAAAGTKDANDKPVPPGDWGTYVWHPYKQSLASNGDSQVVFPDAYVANSVWVSGNGQGTVNLQLSIAGNNLELAIEKARLAVDITDHKHGKDGNIGGIIETEQFIASLKKIAGNINPSFCGDSPTFDGIASQIRAASDILTDGTQDPTKVCNGISVGIGFTTQASTLGDAVDSAASTDPCAGQ